MCCVKLPFVKYFYAKAKLWPAHCYLLKQKDNIMKDIFKNDNRTAILIGVGALALIAGAAAYFYLSEEGDETKQKLTKKVKDQVRDIASKAIAKKTGLSKKLVRKAAEHVS